MAALEWDVSGSRYFETGVDRGVFFLKDEGSYFSGVPWNGLVSVTVDANNDLAELYFDGKKVFDLVSIGDFSGKITAITYPDELGIGSQGIGQLYGMTVYDQPKRNFGLCWRTKIGNDIDQENHGYKIHVLYDVTAVETETEFSTLADTTSPSLFSWDLVAVPQVIQSFRPTAYVIFDSRKIDPGVWSSLEDLLYGTESTSSTLVTIDTLLDSAVTILIVDNGDDTWSATGPDTLIEMLDGTTFQIQSQTAEYLDVDTYTITSG